MDDHIVIVTVVFIVIIVGSVDSPVFLLSVKVFEGMVKCAVTAVIFTLIGTASLEVGSLKAVR